jgi:paraquat-inducible protein B
LITTNVRFWKESGVAFDMSVQGMRVDMGSLTTLFSSDVSFDMPDGRDRGEQVKEKAE